MQRANSCPKCGVLSVLTKKLAIVGAMAASTSVLLAQAVGPVAYYPLNGDGVDASGNGFNGTLTGTTPTADRFGNPGGALKFANDTDRVNCGNPAAFNFAGPFTISAWVNIDGTRENSYIVAKYDLSAGPAHSYGLGIAGVPYPYAFVGNDSGYADLVAFAAPMNAGQWYALSTVYDGANLNLYANGELISSRFVGGFPPFSNSAALTIGGTSNDQVVGGAIDDVRIYDYALTPEEILAQFDADLPPNDGALVAFYELNHGSGHDKSGNHLNGTVTGTQVVPDRFGKKLRAMSFDGDTDRVDCGDPTQFNFTGNFTLSAWIKMNGAQINKYVVAKYDFDPNTAASSPHSYGLGVDGSANVYGFVGGDSGYLDVVGGPNLGDDAWHAISLAFESGVTLRIYLDGALVASRAVPIMPSFVNSVPLTIGGTSVAQGFAGSIDDVRIYSRALSDSEIDAQYQIDAPQITKKSLKEGLVAYYELNGNGKDKGPNGLDATLIGTTKTEDRNGKPHHALHFNGTTDLINCGNAPAFNFTNSFTLNTWLKVDGDEIEKYLITKFDDTVVHAYGLGIGEDTDPYGFLGGNFGYIDQLTFANMNDGNWHFASLVFKNGENMSLYLDANLVASKFAGFFPPFINSAPLTIGGRLSGQNFQGSLDDVRIYDRPLSEQELEVLMQLK